MFFRHELLAMLSMRDGYHAECERTSSTDMIIRYYDLLQLVDRGFGVSSMTPNRGNGNC